MNGRDTSATQHGWNKKVRAVTIELGCIEDIVTAQGKLEPKNYANVGLQVSGQIGNSMSKSATK
ncbi:MAG: hypothetical protein ACOYNL_04080 [Rickettsiales bacterium]